MTDWRGQPLRWPAGSQASGGEQWVVCVWNTFQGCPAVPSSAWPLGSSGAITHACRSCRLLRTNLLQGDVSACSGEVLAAGDAQAHQQALELLGWQ